MLRRNWKLCLQDVPVEKIGVDWEQPNIFALSLCLKNALQLIAYSAGFVIPSHKTRVSKTPLSLTAPVENAHRALSQKHVLRNNISYVKTERVYEKAELQTLGAILSHVWPVMQSAINIQALQEQTRGNLR